MEVPLRRRWQHPASSHLPGWCPDTHHRSSAAQFEFPTLAHVGLVVPEALDESLVQRHLMGPVVRVFGRVKPGSTLEQAQAELQPLFRDFVESAPPPFRKTLRLEVRSIRDLQIHSSRRAAWLLLISSIAVLLIACANAANLILARSAARRQELAIRSALGGARARLFRQRFTESLVLAFFGGAAGRLLAYEMSTCRKSCTRRDSTSRRRSSGRQSSSGGHRGIADLWSHLRNCPCTGETKLAAAGSRRENRLSKSPRARAQLVGQVWMALVLLAGALLFVRSWLNSQLRDHTQQMSR